MTYYPQDGGAPVTYNLKAARAIEAREDAAPTLEEIERSVYADPNPFPPFTTEAAIYLTLAAVGLFALIKLMRTVSRRSGRKGSKRSRVPKPKNRLYR